MSEAIIHHPCGRDPHAPRLDPSASAMCWLQTRSLQLKAAHCCATSSRNSLTVVHAYPHMCRHTHLCSFNLRLTAFDEHKRWPGLPEELFTTLREQPMLSHPFLSQAQGGVHDVWQADWTDKHTPTLPSTGPRKRTLDPSPKARCPWLPAQPLPPPQPPPPPSCVARQRSSPHYPGWAPPLNLTLNLCAGSPRVPGGVAAPCLRRAGAPTLCRLCSARAGEWRCWGGSPGHPAGVEPGCGAQARATGRRLACTQDRLPAGPRNPAMSKQASLYSFFWKALSKHLAGRARSAPCC